MTESSTARKQGIVGETSSKQSESIIGAISAGFVFILFGSIYVLALPTSLFEKVVAFFGSLSSRQFPGTDIFLPVPTSPAAHSVFYTAIFQFCVGLAFLQLVVLILRLVWNSTAAKTAETLGSLVFWSGAALLSTTLLNAHTTLNTWFVFWAGMLVMAGASLVARSIVLILRK
jgi:hypothetical protein